MSVFKFNPSYRQLFLNARWAFNPLALELHPSAQRCLPRFFTGDFNF
jgi:hypothetical protein